MFHASSTTAVEGEKMCVFVWKAHLAEMETYNLTPPPTDLKPPVCHLLFFFFAFHPTLFLPLPSQTPEGREGSVSGADDVTFWRAGVWSWELEELSHFVYNAGRLWYCICESWNSKNKAYGIQYPFIIYLVVELVSFQLYKILCWTCKKNNCTCYEVSPVIVGMMKGA